MNRFRIRRAASRPTSLRRHRSRGQVIVIFAGAVLAFFALLSIVIDVSWYWANSLRIQRTADAAALAGVVWLPGNPGQASIVALAEAVKNGYTDGVGGTTISADQDASNPRRLVVTIGSPVTTYFARVVGIASFPARRVAKAEFVLPVPMGSPQNYYGIGCMDTNVVGGLTEPACTTGGNTNGPSGVANATNASGYAVTGGTATNQLNSQGFWGVAFTKGGDSRNGDAYLPTDISNPNGPNTEYDLAGYPYTVEVPTGGGGKVFLFDPGFCGMPVLGSGRAGSGDEWTNNMGGTNPAPVSTYFNLYDDNNTPYKLDDDVLVWASGSTFENEKQVDESGAHGSGSPQYPSGSAGITRCDRAGDPNYAYHLKWFQIPATLAAGNYRLQVTTTKVDTSVLGGTTVLDASENADVGAANRFGIEVTSTSGSPRVYGGGRMAGYANVQAGQQRFYLAQIDRTSGAGKTVEIDLYDPGDVGGGAWLQVLSPDGNAYNPATFSFTSRSKASGAVGPSSNSATCIETNRPSSSPPGGIPAGCPAILDGSGSQFDAYWLQILIPLPSTYGSVGLTPSGETEAGWWKIQYNVAGGNDTTTWQVNIRGNPVHLVIP